MKPIVHYTKSEFYQGEDDVGEPRSEEHTSELQSH